MVGIAYSIGKMILLNHGDKNWISVSNEQGDHLWTSETSFSKLRYCLKRYTLGKILSTIPQKYKKVKKIIWIKKLL